MCIVLMKLYEFAGVGWGSSGSVSGRRGACRGCEGVSVRVSGFDKVDSASSLSQERTGSGRHGCFVTVKVNGGARVGQSPHRDEVDSVGDVQDVEKVKFHLRTSGREEVHVRCSCTEDVRVRANLAQRASGDGVITAK